MRNPDPECPGCGRPLPTDPAELAGLAACPHCRGELTATVFPAYGRGPVIGGTAERTTADDEATCFFHPSKKAAVPCDRCGRFLCALCDLPIAGEHLCPGCVQSAQKKEGLSGVGRPRLRWDIIVWNLVLLPLLACSLVSPVTGLAAAGLAVWGLRAPPSRVVPTRARLWAGLVAGLVVAAGGTVFWIVAATR